MALYCSPAPDLILEKYIRLLKIIWAHIETCCVGLLRKSIAVVLSWRQFCPPGVSATRIYWIEARDAAKYPRIYRIVPHHKELPSPNASTCPGLQLKKQGTTMVTLRPSAIKIRMSQHNKPVYVSNLTLEI